MQIFAIATWNLFLPSLLNVFCFGFCLSPQKLILNCQARQLTQESIRSLIVFIYFIVVAVLSILCCCCCCCCCQQQYSYSPKCGSAMAVVGLVNAITRLFALIAPALSGYTLCTASLDVVVLFAFIFIPVWFFIYIFGVHNVLTAQSVARGRCLSVN